jgi:hypothetical protein
VHIDDETDDYRQDPLDVYADAAKDMVRSTPAKDVVQTTDDILFVSMQAVEDIGRRHPAVQRQLVHKIRLHVHELRELVIGWQEDAREADAVQRVARRRR